MAAGAAGRRGHGDGDCFDRLDGRLLKTNSKNDASRDLRSDRPIFKAHGIDKIPLLFKILRET